MMPDKKRRYPSDPEQDPIFDQENVASFTECTGIAPLGLQDGWQQNNTAALYAIHHAQKRQDDENPLDDEDWPQ